MVTLKFICAKGRLNNWSRFYACHLYKLLGMDKIPTLALSNRFIGYNLSRYNVAPPLSDANLRKIFKNGNNMFDFITP